MNYQIAAQSRYLRAEMSDRETGEETREFFRAVILEYIKHRPSSILLDFRSSRPVFLVKPHGFLEFFSMLTDGQSCKVALLGDAEVLQMSHEYVALLAQQQGMDVQSFRDETAALRWLGERRHQQDRRQWQNQRNRQAQAPRPEERRQQKRRVELQSGLSA
jgi:hypothetical protein